MPEYRPLELLKSAKDLCTFDAICVGGPINGEFRSLGKLPMQNLCEIIDSHTKSRFENVRVFPYRLGAHMKYRLTLLRRRGLVYVAWVHDSVPLSINSEATASLDAALEKSETIAPTEERAIEAAPFEPGDRVAPNGGYIADAVTVKRVFHRDGQWWFIPMHGKAVARDCQCWVLVEQHAGPQPLDKEDENAAKDATPDPKHKVLSDAEMFGPTQLFNTTNNHGENVTYGIDWSKLELMSYQKNAFAPTPDVNRTVAPFRVGQMVRRKSDGRLCLVEAIKYVDAENCWAIRIPGHDRPYDAAMFDVSGAGSVNVNVAPPADPQPLGARPRRRIIRKERPQ